MDGERPHRCRVEGWLRRGTVRFSYAAFAICAAMPATAGSLSNIGVAFDIPAQSLSRSLQDFSAATGIEVLVDGRHTANVRAPALKGTMAARPALVVLLGHTNLAPEELSSGTVVLNIVQPPSMRVPGDEQPYFADIQTAFQTALCRNGLTSQGRYRLAVKFWVAPSGDVVRAARLDTTGDDRLDRALDAVISHVQIGKAPPLHLAQPIALVISPGDTRAGRDCASDVAPASLPAIQ